MPRFEFRGKYYNNPVELSLDIIGGKWKMPILWRLKERSWRYGELKKNIGKITHKMLAEQLKELERDGLISRKVYPEVPPKVEYSLTERGFSTIPIIEGLRAWGSNLRENKI
ncbi:MAG: helix-turn-helix transcriptional regulator [Ignavibacterium sp.]|jgi:DNA-binding HxlR family transcriptional regulator|nr:helix-turn-helix transcriptional regulator [Ignavibacterium sp.]